MTPIICRNLIRIDMAKNKKARKINVLRAFSFRRRSSWSGRQDSNLRPPAPKAGAITGLRYAPNFRLDKVMRESPNSLCGEVGFRSAGWRNSLTQTHFAVREGFEPSVQFNPYDGLANRSFRPLRHLTNPFHFFEWVAKIRVIVLPY
jgi:hypothetical protein